MQLQISTTGRVNKQCILATSALFRIVHTCWGKNVLDKDEDGLLRTQLDALANDIDKLADSEVRWNQVPAVPQTFP